MCMFRSVGQVAAPGAKSGVSDCILLALLYRSLPVATPESPHPRPDRRDSRLIVPMHVT